MPSERAAMILCTHDLGLTPSSDMGERAYWFAFEDFRPLVDQLTLAADSYGYGLELTSDDAFASDHAQLFPWLMETGRRATFFVPAGFVGKPGRLTATELREMQAAGMCFACHGFDHLDWTKADEPSLRHEIADAKAMLEDLLGAAITRVAPPFGAYDTRVFKALVASGFSEIFTTRGGFSLPGGRLKPRVVLQRDEQRVARLLTLSRRRPDFRDGVRCGLHELQARFT